LSTWVQALFSKFVCGRLLQDWNDQGLHISQGTLTDGLRCLLPMFAPLVEAGLAQLRSGSHWHADETRREVYKELDGKVGHRWYLWVFKSATVVCFVLDPSRSSKVPGATLQGVSQGILSVGRYAAYRNFARQAPGVSLSICWRTHAGTSCGWPMTIRRCGTGRWVGSSRSHSCTGCMRCVVSTTTAPPIRRP
jgi:transposase